MGKLIALEDFLTMVQSHQVTTEDGYLLTLFRVTEANFNLNTLNSPNSQNKVDANCVASISEGIEEFSIKEKEANHVNKSAEENGTHSHIAHVDSSSRPPVLLLHGLMSDGSHWFINDKEKTLPYILCKQGYDVWIGSYRGTTYSKEHITLSNSSKQYWDFGAREIGVYDVPAFIDYVLNTTGHKSLYYVGHSFGNTILYVGLSLKPEYNEKVAAAACMCPAVYGNHVRKLGVRLGGPLYTLLGKSQFIRRKEFGSNCQSYFKLVCSPVRNKLASSMLNMTGSMLGLLNPASNISKARLSQMSRSMPSSTSVKLLCHIMQCFRAGAFREYDYGRSKNMTVYGQPCPPPYDLKRVTIPVATFTSAYDKLIPSQDVARVAKELPNLIGHYETSNPIMSHVEFIIGHDRSTVVYDRIVEVFNETRNKTHL